MPLDQLRPAASTRGPLVSTILLALAIVVMAAVPAGAGAAPSTCDKLASAKASDAGNGSPASPFRTAQALVDALGPGQVGCLQGGTYGGGLTFAHGGSAGAPIVLRSSPGEQALVAGRVWVQRGSDNVTVADLALDGNYQDPSERLPSPTINADNVIFEHDDVTNDHTEICFDVGSETWGRADATVIAYDHIHDCGVMPAANHDHGIYVQDATNFEVVGNLIDHNADRGIQLYPNGARGLIVGNVISENGEGLIFSGEEGAASSDNLVEHNLIVNSLVRADIESWYPPGTPAGVNNMARENCVSRRGIDMSDAGFSAQGNVVASPGELTSTGGSGVTAAPGSACAAALAGLPMPVARAASVKHTAHARKLRRRHARRHARRHGLRTGRRGHGRGVAVAHRRARPSGSQAGERRR